MKTKGIKLKKLPIPMATNWFAQLFEAKADSESVMSLMKKYYRPFSPQFEPQLLLLLPSFMIKKYNGSIYFGEILNDYRNGNGILICIDGRIYEGQWRDDLKDGCGNELFNNKNRYEGYFLKGKPQGNGVYLWANGESYDGQWKQGKKHGSGVWRGSKGDCYMGEWKEGCADGFGVHVWVNGDRYEGQFLKNLKNGQGKEIFQNGDIYIGSYMNGKPDGIGEYYWKDLSMKESSARISFNTHYKGSFKNGFRNGIGVWTKYLNDQQSEFEQYRGHYQNDKKSGIGVYQWPNGNIYKGQFANDLRDGLGIMLWSDGSIYQGNWQQGIRQGEGLLCLKDQEIIHALFKNSEIFQVLKDKQQSFELEKRMEQVFEQIKDCGVNIPIQFSTDALIAEISKLEKLPTITQRIFKTANKIGHHQSTTDSSINEHYNTTFYESLNTKLRSEQFQRFNPDLKQYQVEQRQSLKTKQPLKLSNKKFQRLLKKKKSQLFAYDLQKIDQTEQDTYFQMENCTQDQFKSLYSINPVSPFYHKIKQQNPIKVRRPNQSFDITTAEKSYYIPSVKNDYRSERSSGSVKKHVEKSLRNNSETGVKKVWVPSGPLKRQPDSDYISC